MSIGKDSIQKRVAKTTENTEPVVDATAERVETKSATSKKPAAKRTTGTTAGKSAAKSPTKKPAAPKAEDAPAVGTAVMANVSPEVVEKVTGHPENAKVAHVQIGGKMPSYLL